MNIKQLILSLSSADGVTGLCGALDVAEVYLSKFGSVTRDRVGGLVCKIGTGKRKIMLDAHIDEIGFVVTAVDKGFLRVAKCGGIDVRTLTNQEVTVHGKEKLFGVFASMPPHLKKDDDTVSELDSMVIDCGMSHEQLNKLVTVGDRVSFRCEPIELINGRISGKSLDNRAGVAAAIYAASMINTDKADCTLVVSLSAQEELGLRGARTAAFSNICDEAVVIDVSFADGPDIPPTKCGKLGAGAMIGVSPILDRDATNGLKAAAERVGAKYQLEVMGGTTGTNADVISVTGGGIPTSLVSIPLRNMHTACEIIDLADVKTCADIIVDYISNGGFTNAE